MEVKAALRTLWKDTCTVVEYREFIRENKSVGHHEVAVLVDEPCKLSFESLQVAQQSGTISDVSQTAKLFIDNEVTIKAGSKIIVKRTENVYEFKQSGEAGVFTNHQEIMLVPFKEYA